MLSIAIATYGREHVLLDTLASILEMDPPADEVLVLDQTETHSPCVSEALANLSRSARVRHFRIPHPSIPAALNVALEKALGDVVLFLDDDIVARRDVVAAHLAAHRETDAALVAGRVIQPWQEGVDFSNETNFHFATTRSAWVDEFIGANFSIRRDLARELGGFDENFVRVAYHFEAEFSFRLRRAGYKIYYEPRACIHHLKTLAGGTRTFGEHLRTVSPDHSVGAYYCFLRTWSGKPTIQKLLSRPVRAIATRHHLRHPWWIPITMLAELRGFLWALVLVVQGPKYAFRLDSSPRPNSKC